MGRELASSEWTTEDLKSQLEYFNLDPAPWGLEWGVKREAIKIELEEREEHESRVSRW